MKTSYFIVKQCLMLLLTLFKQEFLTFDDRAREQPLPDPFQAANSFSRTTFTI